MGNLVRRLLSLWVKQRPIPEPLEAPEGSCAIPECPCLGYHDGAMPV